MSSKSRATVLNSFRFKSESLPFELFYVSLIAYVLYTRTVADIEEYALPIFLALVAGYQIAGLLWQVWNRRVPDLWDIVYWTFGTIIFSASYVLATYGAIAIAIDVWGWLEAFWAELDPLTNQTQFMVATGLMTVTAGALFFWFRLKQRFLYGFTEASVGVVVGMHRVTLEQWSGVPKNTGFYLALLTAGIYLVVRGIDNMHQAHRNGDPTLQRLARLVLRNQFPSNVTPRRVSRRRPTSMRKATTVER